MNVNGKSSIRVVENPNEKQTKNKTKKQKQKKHLFNFLLKVGIDETKTDITFSLNY